MPFVGSPINPRFSLQIIARSVARGVGRLENTLFAAFGLVRGRSTGGLSNVASLNMWSGLSLNAPRPVKLLMGPHHAARPDYPVWSDREELSEHRGLRESASIGKTAQAFQPAMATDRSTGLLHLLPFAGSPMHQRLMSSSFARPVARGVRPHKESQ